ncbi:MAG: hypothetical protein WCC27_22380 [Acidobacteriaceae bacterium]
MTIAVEATKHAVHDKLESQVRSLAATIAQLKAKAQNSKADAELKAIANLAATQLRIHQKLDELSKAGDEKWEQNKANIESLITSFEKSVRDLEAKMKAH